MATLSHLPTLAEEWSCPQCTFNNKISDRRRCEICFYEEKSEDDVCIGDSSMCVWACPRCTLHNEMKSDYCKACQMQKDLGHTQEISRENLLELTRKQRTMTVRDRRHFDEEEAKKRYQNIVAYCRKHRHPFVDDCFPPNARSLGTQSFRSFSKWLRVMEIKPSSDEARDAKWTVLANPSPSDIQQGELGNCWLVATIALVSENAKLLEDILVIREINEEGVYFVRLCHNGLWKFVIVDDCFPCRQDRRLVFTQAKRRQLYVPLIEKACAKIFGSYSALRSGTTLEGLQLLTGAPCDHIELQSTKYPIDSDMIWIKLLSGCEAKLLIGVSSANTNVTREEYERVHIHRNHAFSILAAHALSDRVSRSNEYRYVLVRDPHSYSRYSEPTLNKEILEILRLNNSADRSSGSFWIAWGSFLRYFSSISISRYNVDMYDMRETGKFTRSASENLQNYQFELTERSSICISLIYHRKDRSIPNRHIQSFILCDIERIGKRKELVFGRRMIVLKSKRAGFVDWQGILDAGTYTLLPFSFTFWYEQQKSSKFTVVIHSSVALKPRIQVVPATYLADCLIAAVQEYSTYKKEKNNSAIFGISRADKFSIQIAENKSRTDFLSVDISFNSDTKNLLHFPFKQRTLACIPPGHRQIVLVMEWNDQRHDTGAVGYQQSMHHVKDYFNSIPEIDNSRQNLHSPRPMP